MAANVMKRQQALVSDDLPDSEDLISPQDTVIAINGSIVDLASFFSHKKDELEAIAKEFSVFVLEIEDKASAPKSGELGGCWLWILDNTSILTRALIENERVMVTESGKYLVHLYEFNDFRSPQERKEMTQELATLITNCFSVECGYFYVSNSDNPNDLPFYNSDHLDNHMHYNVCWEC